MLVDHRVLVALNDMVTLILRINHLHLLIMLSFRRIVFNCSIWIQASRFEFRDVFVGIIISSLRVRQFRQLLVFLCLVFVSTAISGGGLSWSFLLRVRLLLFFVAWKLATLRKLRLLIRFRMRCARRGIAVR